MGPDGQPMLKQAGKNGHDPMSVNNLLSSAPVEKKKAKESRKLGCAKRSKPNSRALKAPRHQRYDVVSALLNEKCDLKFAQLWQRQCFGNATLVVKHN